MAKLKKATKATVLKKATKVVSTPTNAPTGLPRARPVITIPASQRPRPAEATNGHPPSPNPLEDPEPSPPAQDATAPLQPSTTSTNPNLQMTPGPTDIPAPPNSATSTSAPTQAVNPPMQSAMSNPTDPGSTQLAKPTATRDLASVSNQGDLAAKYAIALAEIDRLKKQESATQSNELSVKRPAKRIVDLQKAMGLEDNRSLYISCRSTVRDVMTQAGIPFEQVWRKQEPLVLAKIITLAKSRNPQLAHYENGWATLEIMRTTSKNKRNYRKKIGRTSGEPNEMRESSDEDAFTDSGNEAETSSAGKRKQVAQGGTSKKART